MQRIQYHRFPRAIGTDFSGVLESIGNRRGEFIPMLRLYWPKETSPSTDADVLGFSSGHTPGLNLVDAHASAAP
jgi:hypothetical protein